MLKTLRRSLGLKIFVSYLVIILVGVGALLLASEWSIPSSYAHHIAGMQGMMGGMAGGGMMSDLFLGFRAVLQAREQGIKLLRSKVSKL